MATMAAVGAGMDIAGRLAHGLTRLSMAPASVHTGVLASSSAGLTALKAGAVSVLSPLAPLFDGWLLAVPKNRRSKYRNRTRRSDIGKVDPMKHLSKCHICNSPMLMHHVCPVCYKKVRKEVAQLRSSAAAAE